MGPDTAHADGLTDAQYHALASAAVGAVEAATDRWLQDDVIDIDTHRTGGLLELAFPDGSKIIVNTQPPLHEVWLAGCGQKGALMLPAPAAAASAAAAK